MGNLGWGLGGGPVTCWQMEVLGGGMRRALPRPRFSRWRCWAKSFSSRRSAASNALQYWGWGRNGGQMDRDGGQRGPKWHQNGVSGV